MTPAKEIIGILVRCNVIPADYTGQVILHIGKGNLCDVENYVQSRTKGLKRLLENQTKEENHGIIK